jgi:uncharacterized protein (DUF58 family)
MNRLLLLGIILYTLVLLGFVLLSGGVLALIIPILVFIGSALLFGPEEPQLTVERELSAESASLERPVKVKLKITNNGSRLEAFHLADAPPEGLELIDGDAEVLTSLVSGESFDLDYTVLGRRGRYRFKPIHIWTSDLFGLLFRETKVEAPGLFEFYIYPKVVPIDRIPIRPKQTKVYAGYIPARIGGSGVEFFNVRTYQAGDSLRHINWRANARHPGTFFTNEFEQERVADVGIILDARQRSNVEFKDDTLFEYSIIATAALADSFLNDGNRVAVLRYGDFLDWTVPGYGKLQRERILRSLARAQTGDSLVFDQLEHLPAQLFSPKSQIVLVSPLASGDVEFLKRLRSRGYDLLIISPDPLAFEMQFLEEDEIVKTAFRLAYIERRLLFGQLRQVGIQVFNWQVDIPFDQAITSSLPQLRPIIGRNIGILPT